jgi:lipopolysaccharide/colanic/teichoic acid biosynthesis glycosyltransferase
MFPDAEKESGPVWAVKNDPRVTRVGYYLRATRIDELPQLLNVLRGEMSLVGPRPERPFFVEKLIKNIPNYDARLLVRPGVTGLAQIMQDYSGSVSNIRRKISHDIEYVRNLKLLRDLAIILRTVVVVLTARGG